MENFVIKEIYNVIKEYLCPVLRSVNIMRSPFGRGNPDYLLHAVCVKYVEVFECDIDPGLSTAWSENSNRE